MFPDGLVTNHAPWYVFVLWDTITIVLGVLILWMFARMCGRS